MTNPNAPAFSTDWRNQEHLDARETWPDPVGLTKREYFAAMAMQGLLAQDTESGWSYDRLAKYAAEQADALIAELNKSA